MTFEETLKKIAELTGLTVVPNPNLKQVSKWEREAVVRSPTGVVLFYIRLRRVPSLYTCGTWKIERSSIIFPSSVINDHLERFEQGLAL